MSRFVIASFLIVVLFAFDSVDSADSQLNKKIEILNDRIDYHQKSDSIVKPNSNWTVSNRYTTGKRVNGW